MKTYFSAVCTRGMICVYKLTRTASIAGLEYLYSFFLDSVLIYFLRFICIDKFYCIVSIKESNKKHILSKNTHHL